MDKIWHRAIGSSLFYIMTTSLEPWGCKDKNSVFVFANDAYKKLLGIPIAFDISGRKDGELPAPTSDFEREFQLHDRRTENEQQTLSSLEVHQFGKSSSIEAYRFEKMPCIDSTGVIGTIFHGVKLSEQYINLSYQLNQLVGVHNTPIASFSEGNHLNGLLSSREHEILFLIGLGFSTKEIASRLNLGNRTIENYLAKIRTRFGVKKTQKLREMAWEYGWVNNIPKRFLTPRSVIIN